MVHSPKLTVVTNGEYQTDIGFALDETILFGSFEFIADRFGRPSLSPKGNDSGAAFVGMVHSGSLLLHAILKESTDEGDIASSGGGSSNIPISRGCNVVTPSVPITTTPLSEGTKSPLTIATVLLWTVIRHPDIGLLPEQQARAHAQQDDAEQRATQRRGDLINGQAAIEAQLTELHHRKSMLEAEWSITVDLTTAQAQARDVAAAINHKGTQCPAFARANQNVATADVLLDTLLAPSVDGVDRVYRQLKYILDIVAAQQTESSLQHWAEVSISSTGCSKAGR
jgi:hypothetical protein